MKRKISGLDIPKLRKEGEQTIAKGKEWLRIHPKVLKRIPKGHYIVVNTEAGKYATGSTLSEARRRYGKRFKKGAGYCYRVGLPVFSRYSLFR